MSLIQLDTFVISLAKSVEKREYIMPQLKKHSWLKVRMFDAIYGPELSHDDMKTIVDPAISLEFGTQKETMSPGDIGCAASHIEAYHHMIENNISHMMVCEDDFKFFPTFEKNVQAILSSGVLDTDEPIVIICTKPHRYYTKAHAKFDDVGLFPIYTAKCAGCYLLNLPAAKFLYEALRPIARVADCWAYLSSIGGLTILSCVPHLAGHNYDLPSELEAIRARRVEFKKAKRSFGMRLRKLWRQTKFNCFKLWMAGRLKKYTGPDDLYPDA